MPARMRHPFGEALQKPLYYRALTPGVIGGLSAAALGALPRVPSLPADIRLPAKLENIVVKIPTRAYMMLLGFILGLSLSKGVGWFRLRVLRSLLSYQGWVTDARSTKTKAWAMLLKIFKGPKPFNTYEFQRLLPKQPLPTLEATLDKWLKVSSQLETQDEFMLTQQAIDSFRKNEGPQLQAHLEKKEKEEVSWLYEYWLNAAYLLNRDPLAINSNYYNSLPLTKSTTTNQLARAATVIQNIVKFAERLDNETIQPVELMDMVPLCMNGYRFIFNCSRVPGEYVDSLVRYAGKKHIIVIRDGKYYSMDMYTVDPKTNKKSMLNIKEIKQQLVDIVEMAKQDKTRCGVAALTTLDRTQWAKHREILAQKNAATLHLVESAMFHVVIDDVEFEGITEDSKRLLTGDGTDRWFDKCFTASISKNAKGGHCVEHSAIDAMVFVTMSEYQTVNEKYDVDGDILCPPNTIIRDVKPPQCLEWNLDGLEDTVNSALSDYKSKIDNLDLYILRCPYGKGYMKKQRLSPDGYIQMAIQLAYYNQTKKVVKTYEPSTHRLFALGRTETVHPTSPFSSSWVKSMHDEDLSNHTRRSLLKKAVDSQTKFRLEATVGQGCDRHLLGLYLASRELGMDTPAIFADKPWRAPFTLSSSQTPNNIAYYDSDVDLEGTTGGFAPSCPGGYGLSYVTHGDDILLIAITSWKEDEETDSEEFGREITRAMEQMKNSFA
ncbi:hypothetical protein CAPTEDRAFT_215687 [Capitella teleta]|uniref:Choline/carnitine acyltransferase domain-containing protein n=1 Tax=Capitella teleta TaxID=283909 RepID=R7TK95_CAPTE|nr:hypothetical protein CAPTEDRAFT_215687 [Capitella teleta]|eukprot:ELT93902.1 hypothetical protein CAPTEDRAFT_215687 [Capitella teleta]